MAKPFQEKVIYSNNLFILNEARFSERDYPFHTHPEYEFILVLNSKGKRFAGNNISNYSGSGLYLFGSDLLHNYSKNNTPASTYFNKQFLRTSPGEAHWSTGNNIWKIVADKL